MQFKDIIGNEDLKHSLIKMAEENRVSHAFMFIENEGCGALALVLAYIQYLSCRQKENGAEDSCGSCPVCVKMSRFIHPDVHFAFPVNASGSKDSKPVSGNFIKEWTELLESDPYFTESDLYKKIKIEDKVGAISVNEAKEILNALSLKSYEGYNKYMVIWMPERMSTEAANRLLKIIEEPTPDTYFFFVTHHPENVLATIKSRTFPVSVHPVELNVLTKILEEKFGAAHEKALACARASGGSPGVAFKLISESTSENIYIQTIIDLLQKKVDGDLYSMLTLSDKFVSLGREKQKEFLSHMLDYLRKIFMCKKNLEKISNITPEEKDQIYHFTRNLSERFFIKAVKAIEDAGNSVESNVNAKIIYCNLVNHLFIA